MKFTYCSFASDAGWLGGLLLNGHLTAIEAAARAYQLGLHPGGEMVAVHAPDDLSDEENEWNERNAGRLLTKADLEASPSGMDNDVEKLAMVMEGVVPE